MELQEKNRVSNISAADELHLDNTAAHLRREHDFRHLELSQALLQSSCEHTIVVPALTPCGRQSLKCNKRLSKRTILFSCTSAAREEERATGTTYPPGLLQ
jgi:hypothetical protein